MTIVAADALPFVILYVATSPAQCAARNAARRIDVDRVDEIVFARIASRFEAPSRAANDWQARHTIVVRAEGSDNSSYNNDGNGNSDNKVENASTLNERGTRLKFVVVDDEDNNNNNNDNKNNNNNNNNNNDYSDNTLLSCIDLVWSQPPMSVAALVELDRQQVSTKQKYCEIYALQRQ